MSEKTQEIIRRHTHTHMNTETGTHTHTNNEREGRDHHSVMITHFEPIYAICMNTVITDHSYSHLRRAKKKKKSTVEPVLCVFRMNSQKIKRARRARTRVSYAYYARFIVFVLLLPHRFRMHTHTFCVDRHTRVNI